jgi:hypothetical protein
MEFLGILALNHPQFDAVKYEVQRPRAPGITSSRCLLEFANLSVQDTLVVLDYERISVIASQALTEANKMGPCLEPWSETAESWFAYALILPF